MKKFKILNKWKEGANFGKREYKSHSIEDGSDELSSTCDCTERIEENKHKAFLPSKNPIFAELPNLVEVSDGQLLLLTLLLLP